MFAKLQQEYGIYDEAGELLLRTAMESLTELRQMQATIRRDGQTVTDRYNQVKPHPLLSPLRDARSQMLAAMKMLNLDIEPLRDGPGRPPTR